MRRLISHIVFFSAIGYMLIEALGSPRVWVIAVVAAIWAVVSAVAIYRYRGRIKASFQKMPAFRFAKIRIGFPTGNDVPASDSVQDRIAVYASYVLYVVLAGLSLAGIIYYFKHGALPGGTLEKWLVPVAILLAVLSIFRKRYRYVAWLKKRMER